MRPASITRLLKRHRIRRIDAPAVLEILREAPVIVAPGTAQAASAHLRLVFAQLDLIGTQITEAHQQIDRLVATLAESEDPTGIDTQRDVDILRSLPGVGRTVLATLLAEAYDPLRRRDYQALRCLSGVAPVTRRSGKSLSVVRRLAAHNRLRCALHHWAAIAVQHDTVSQAKYQALRERGHGHARALRSVADRRLAVACARLETQTLFDPSTSASVTAGTAVGSGTAQGGGSSSPNRAARTGNAFAAADRQGFPRTSHQPVRTHNPRPNACRLRPPVRSAPANQSSVCESKWRRPTGMTRHINQPDHRYKYELLQGPGPVTKSDAHNLLERLAAHRGNVLRFTRRADTPFSNNRAERDIRMAKVKQKVSGCFRTVAFAEAYCQISSYLRTMTALGYNPLVAITIALQEKAVDCLYEGS